MRKERSLEPREDDNPICPVCGWECETLYRNENGDVLGCDVCIETKDAAEWWQEHEEEMRYHGV